MFEILRNTCVLVAEVNERRFYTSLQDNPSAKALIKRLTSARLTVTLQDEGGLKKTGDLPWELPGNDGPVECKPGDIVLAGGKKITLCLDETTGTGTVLARLDYIPKAELVSAFGSGDATVRFFLEWDE